ncbi:MAG: hypothetical protein JWO65_112 [Sphingomonas bacterium]|jgi:hypothetical protein|nr:hypothetical protein [Sphingomonas bacterium]
MKLILAATAFATLSIGIVSAADARPPMHHHKQCKWVMQHHHKVKRCW